MYLPYYMYIYEKQIDSRSPDQLQIICFFTNICLKYMEFDFKKIERQNVTFKITRIAR